MKIIKSPTASSYVYFPPVYYVLVHPQNTECQENQTPGDPEQVYMITQRTELTNVQILRHPCYRRGAPILLKMNKKLNVLVRKLSIVL